MKCYYSDEECWREERPEEGSGICTNCLIARHIGGFHPILKRTQTKKPVEEK